MAAGCASYGRDHGARFAMVGNESGLAIRRGAGERQKASFGFSNTDRHHIPLPGLAERLPEGPERSVETLAARLRLAEALTEAGRFKDATTHSLVAAEQARQANDTDSFVRVALGYEHAEEFLGVPLHQSVALLTEAEAKIARDDDQRRCLILTLLARAHLILGSPACRGRDDRWPQ